MRRISYLIEACHVPVFGLLPVGRSGGRAEVQFTSTATVHIAYCFPPLLMHLGCVKVI